MQTVRNDLHQRITQQIIEAIEAGAGDYRMPWNAKGSSASLPQNPVGKYEYHGINVLSLWASQQLQSFTTGQWATYRQWLSIGAQVRKGERGCPTVFYQPLLEKPIPRAGDDREAMASEKSNRPFIFKIATVFNANQVDGYHLPDLSGDSHIQKHSDAEEIIGNAGARILWGGSEACYLPKRDEIHLPPQNAFRSSEGYYGVAFHELTHWTGHSSRCNRDLTGRFGSAAYAMEELVAELGAAFLSAETGMSPEPRADHAQYIASWISVLQRDPEAIFAAARKASNAANWLMARSGQADEKQ